MLSVFLRYLNPRGFAKHCIATIQLEKIDIKVSSGPETSKIALTVSSVLLLVVALACYITEGNLDNSPKPLVPNSRVIELHLFSALVTTS